MAESREALLKRLEDQALLIRRNSWRALRASNGGHVGGAMSAAEILSALYFHRMQIRPDEPDWPDRDRFILSKGHGNAALSSVLAQAGFFPESDLDRFYHLESPLGMHPDIKVAGVEMSTGGEIGRASCVGKGESSGVSG